MGGGWQRVEVQVKSMSGAPLTLNSVCLVDGDGRCLESNDDQVYRLCENTQATPAQCDPIDLGDPLPFEETRSYTKGFAHGR